MRYYILFKIMDSIRFTFLYSFEPSPPLALPGGMETPESYTTGQLKKKKIALVSLCAYPYAVDNMCIFSCLHSHLVYVCGLIITATECLHHATTFPLISKFFVLVGIWDIEANLLQRNDHDDGIYETKLECLPTFSTHRTKECC